ncbi:MAG: radical SAM protein [Weeksellaceae bacterium]
MSKSELNQGLSNVRFDTKQPVSSEDTLLFDYAPQAIEVPANFVPPYRVNYETNEVCNMPCGFCFADYHEGANVHESLGMPTHGKLGTAEVKSMMEQAAQLGTTQFLLGGGDPFIRRDMPDLIEYASALGLHVVVDTNGLILGKNEELFQRVAPHLHQLGLSLDGSSAEMHDGFRETRNSFERVMRLIEMSAGQAFKLKINTIVTAANMHDIPAMVELLAPHAGTIQRWSLDQFIPVNRGKQNEDKYRISDADYLATVQRVKEQIDERFANCTIGGGLKSAKAGTVMMFGPQGIPYVTTGDQKRYLPHSIRTRPLHQLVQVAEEMDLDLNGMNNERYSTGYYSENQ